MNKDSSICGICGKVRVANEPHYCTTGTPKDVDEIMQELKEAAENWKASDGFTSITTLTPVVSDLELKIRKEVMEAVGKLEAELFKMQTIENVKYMEIIKDRLNLLWDR